MRQSRSQRSSREWHPLEDEREQRLWLAVCTGEWLVSSGRFEEAEQQLTTSFAISDTFHRAWEAVGTLFHRQDQLPQAVRAFRKHLSLCPGCGDSKLSRPSADAPTRCNNPSLAVFFALGGILERQQAWSEARKVYLEGAEWFSWSPSVWVGAARATCMGMSMSGDKAQLGVAEAALGEATVLDHQRADSWGWLAFTYLKRELIEEARECVHNALKLDLRDEKLWSVLGSEFHTLELLEDAHECLTRALRIKDSGSDRLALANVLECMNMQERALSQYEHVAKSESRDDAREVAQGKCEQLKVL